jgi:hypothetical protein
MSKVEDAKSGVSFGTGCMICELVMLLQSRSLMQTYFELEQLVRFTPVSNAPASRELGQAEVKRNQAPAPHLSTSI